ncbi:MAG: hypothetical protein M4579_006614 [Chaenotheca gracillima]|nr:MAG: hypothetical protein M4579_006614 [Chaenotheca gracillima]
MRGKTLRQVSTGLDTHSLGKPSEVVILHEERDAARDPQRKPTAQDEDDTESPITASQLLESAYAERGLLAEIEVNRNIDRLRPASDSVIPADELARLEEKLSLGFTRWQLDRYLQTAKAESEAVKVRATPTLDSSMRFRQSDWTPGVTPFDGSNPTELKAGSGSQKRKLIQRITRKCWTLLTKEEGEGQGELDFVVITPILSLLLHQSRGLLSSVATNRGVKIDVSKTRSLIRITAPKSMAEAAAQELRHVASQVIISTINLRPLDEMGQRVKGVSSEWKLSDILRKAIEDTTGTILEVSGKERVSIYCIGPDRSSIEDAVRLLLSSIPNAANVRRQVLNDSIYPNEGSHLVVQGQTKGLALLEQAKTWCRIWSKPETEQSSDTEDRKHPKSQTLNELVKHHSKLFHNEGQTKHAPEFASSPSPLPIRTVHASKLARWNLQPTSSTFATFGHVLHESAGPDALTSIPAAASQESRAFSYTAPNILNCISKMPHKGSEVKAPSEYLHIWLRPSPWTRLGHDDGQRLTSNAPAVDIVLRLNPLTKKPSIKAVSAVLAERSSDIMLPYSSTDLRLRTLSTLRLDQPHNHPQISEFVAQSDLDITGQGRLRTPDTLRVSLPKRFFEPRENPTAFLAKQDDSGELIELEYYFMGLEYRQSVRLNIDGWRAQYATIEGGRTGGGRRGELRMVMDGRTSFDDEDAEEGDKEDEDAEELEQDEEDETINQEREDSHGGPPSTERASMAEPPLSAQAQLRAFIVSAFKFADLTDQRRHETDDEPQSLQVRIPTRKKRDERHN